MTERAVSNTSSRPQNRVRNRLTPLAMGYQPSLASVSRSTGAGRSSSSRVPSSMTDRSAAKASSARVPVKHEPGSISAIKDRDDTSSRLSTRPQQSRISRAKPLIGRPKPVVEREHLLGAAAPLRRGHPRPQLGLVEPQVEDGVVQLERRCQQPSLSAAADASASAVSGCGVRGPATSNRATPFARSNSTVTFSARTPASFRRGSMPRTPGAPSRAGPVGPTEPAASASARKNGPAPRTGD